MKTKKNDVLEALAKVHPKKNLRYNDLYDLLKKSDQVSPNLLNFLNRSGFSETNLQTVEYELKKIHKISDSEIRKFNSVQSTKTPTLLDLFIEGLAKIDKDLAVKLLIILKFRFEFTDIETRNMVSEEFKAYLNDTKPLEEFERKHAVLDAQINEATLGDALREYLQKNVQYPDEFLEEVNFLKNVNIADSKVDAEDVKKVVELFASSSDEVKTEIKFRDEFPFLNNEDCPVKLKSLVTDKFTHYHAFCDAHQELFEGVVLPYLEGEKPENCEQIKNDVIFGLAKKAIENFTGDQLIYDELLHYRETGTILGKHPIFADEKVVENPFKALSAQELAKKKANLDNYIRRDTNKAENAKDEVTKQKFLAKVVEWNLDLGLVNAELDARK